MWGGGPTKEDMFWVRSTYGQKTRALDFRENCDNIKSVCIILLNKSICLKKIKMMSLEK